LTQQFMLGGNAAAPLRTLASNDARLYRFFEFAGTRDLFAGTTIASRVQGR